MPCPESLRRKDADQVQVPSLFLVNSLVETEIDGETSVPLISSASPWIRAVPLRRLGEGLLFEDMMTVKTQEM